MTADSPYCWRCGPPVIATHRGRDRYGKLWHACQALSMTPEVTRGIGNEKDGGYRMQFRTRCKVDFMSLNDSEAMAAFLAHNRKQCKCFTEKKT